MESGCFSLGMPRRRAFTCRASVLRGLAVWHKNRAAMTPSNDLRVHWFRVLVDLNRAGYSTREFAHAIGVPRSTITGWKAGAEPRHSDGERLLRLWCHAVGKSRERVPMVGAFDFRA